MFVYAVARLCDKHLGQRIGPPIALYFTQEYAEQRLREWKEEHSWDEAEYFIQPLRVIGSCLDEEKTVHVIIRNCEQGGLFSEEEFRCGPAVSAYCEREVALQAIEDWKLLHIWDLIDYNVKEMYVRGDRRKFSCIKYRFGKNRREN